MKGLIVLTTPCFQLRRFGVDKLMQKYPTHFIGIICWLPTHRIGKKRFPPSLNFTAIARFTSDLSGPTLEADINYSPFPVVDDGCFKVRLYYRTLVGKNDEIKRLARYTEILIMDGHKVIAVCRNISLPDSPISIDDEWQPET
jgi:hypothetical protein